MRRVGVREFKDRATTLLAAEEALVIERHGKPVGLYIPIVGKDKTAASEAADKLQSSVTEVLDRTGMTEDELVAFFTEGWEHSVRDAARR